MQTGTSSWNPSSENLIRTQRHEVDEQACKMPCYRFILMTFTSNSETNGVGHGGETLA